MTPIVPRVEVGEAAVHGVRPAEAGEAVVD